jgi:hypothetical protein
LGVFVKHGGEMTKQLMHVAPRQAAKVMALLWIAITIPFVLLMAVGILASGAPNKPNPAVFLLFPLLYGVFGYLFTLLGASVYNVVARRFGGIEFTTSDGPDTDPAKPL